ncbi:Tc5 transposase DNA-binding domain-containing protein [Metschnikowia aff. pulcherrima]|uniref:Tc5 transposase DNA-binding domain-containing protein n=1 Tax=Metschnikowia aff. pulcherrima TaxID=2163413 RepID=A0A4P6XF05_9ASCO|nr:Tc5 transposase DNA-binding domain-containing protein [Metschnikowia aff. pulcherrima]
MVPRERVAFFAALESRVARNGLIYLSTAIVICSTLCGTMGVRRHHPITNNERRLLRKHHRNAKLSLEATAKWFRGTLKRSIAKSTVSESLSAKWAWIDNTSVNGKVKRNRAPKWPLLDKVLFEWLLEQESRNQSTTTETLTWAGRKIWETLPAEAKVDRETGNPVEEPSFSPGWLSRFKKRHKISLRRKYGEVASVPETAHEEMKRIRLIAKEYPLDSIYSMDECGLYWRRGPAMGLSTVQLPGPTAEEKSRISITLCTNADGSDKLPPHFIGKSENPRAFGVTEKSTPKWEWTSNKIAWMTTEIMVEWLQDFSIHVGDKKVLLLMDNFAPHRCAALQADTPETVRIEFLPANSTSIYQPLDRGIVHNAKQHYLKRLLREQYHFYNLRSAATAAGSQTAVTKPLISLKDALWWFYEAWSEKVQPDSIQNCFRKSTLFEENHPEDEADSLEISDEVTQLYNAVVIAGNFENAVSLREFAFPKGENEPPFSAHPTIAELVTCHLPVTKEEEASEDNGAIEPRVVNWAEGVKGGLALLNLLNYSSENSPELRKFVRRAIGVVAKEMDASLIHLTFDDFDTQTRNDETGNLITNSVSAERQRSDIGLQLQMVTALQMNSCGPIVISLDDESHQDEKNHPALLLDCTDNLRDFC